MAEGFLNSKSTNRGSRVKSMEEVGDECFNGLVVHSFFQDVEVERPTYRTTCKMHDLLHDLALSVSNYKMLKLKDESTCFVRTSNHQHYPSAEELENDGASNVRCVISTVVGDFTHMFSTFRSLRSLEISDAGLRELPSAIGRLKHLRYLDISYNIDIKEFPSLITKLYNLQTLRFILCSGIKMLPTDMVNLKRLRHIHFSGPVKIYNVGRLVELRTLNCFVVRTEEGYRIGELKGLNELTSDLRIVGLDNVRDREEAEGANLKEKKLTRLTLEWNADSNCNDENVLEGLVAPPGIKRLDIRGYKGVKLPNWMSMEISNTPTRLNQLVELSLWMCKKCEITPTLRHLPLLEFLKLYGCDNIRCIGSEFYGECKREVTLFPALKKFYLYDMRSLEEWGGVVASIETSVKVFPLLEILYIDDCPHLRSIPLRHLSSLVSLSMSSSDDMEYLSNDFQSLPSLYDLVITDCGNLVSLSSLLDLKSLKRLEILRCDRLTSLPEGLVSLETLVMVSCGDLSLDVFCGMASLKSLSVEEGSMESIPNVELPSCLEELSIEECPKLKTVPHWIKLCTSLRQLTLMRCEDLISIDDDIISSLTQLEVLTLGPFSEELEKFPGLNSIHHLLSLKTLKLFGWPKLTSLPQQLQHLTSLKELIVEDFEGIETLPDWLLFNFGGVFHMI